jgi:DNA mismatch endonuclease (patch repair protein)
MSPEKRSAVMSRIKGRDTGPERIMAALFASRDLSWEEHARDLPGRPDFVFREAMVAVFVDGDFWHGWHFSKWRDKLSEKWEAKIEANRCRDVRNHRCLRRRGWKVIRLWEHQVEINPIFCLERVLHALEVD